MSDRLKGKTAVVAGVGPGMGSAVAVRLAAEGARLVLAARTLERVEAVAKLIRGRKGDAHAVACDLADPVAVKKLLSEATARFGRAPDILANLAGTWKAGDALTYDAAVVDAMLDTNLRTVMTTTPPFAAAMAKAGRGVIVNVAAAFGAGFPTKGQAVYNAAKAGVAAYSESAAADLLAAGVRVNYVMPGGTGHDYAPDRDVAALRRLGRDRTGKPEDVANAILFLVSDEASWITGAGLAVDGGESLRHA